MIDFYAPKTMMEKRRVAQKFDVITLTRLKNPAEY